MTKLISVLWLIITPAIVWSQVGDGALPRRLGLSQYPACGWHKGTDGGSLGLRSLGIGSLGIVPTDTPDALYYYDTTGALHGVGVYPWHLPCQENPGGPVMLAPPSISLDLRAGIRVQTMTIPISAAELENENKALLENLKALVHNDETFMKDYLADEASRHLTVEQQIEGRKHDIFLLKGALNKEQGQLDRPGDGSKK
jgi:hypothetical protein